MTFILLHKYISIFAAKYMRGLPASKHLDIDAFWKSNSLPSKKKSAIKMKEQVTNQFSDRKPADTGNMQVCYASTVLAILLF